MKTRGNRKAPFTPSRHAEGLADAMSAPARVPRSPARRALALPFTRLAQHTGADRRSIPSDTMPESTHAIPPPRDHGGDLDRAMADYGGEDWIDLSTGINRRPWPVGGLPARTWQALPTRAASDALRAVAADWFGTVPERVLPTAGASAPIRLMGRLAVPGRAAVVGPTYNEHAAGLAAEGWPVAQVPEPEALAGFDLGVVVNPNNPDGRSWAPERLAAVARAVGLLVVDESFCDPRPDLSLISASPDNVLILRSFGKFWGLAGLRLGFAVGAPGLLARLADCAGPWPVNGPALAIGAQAMADRDWARASTLYHTEAALRLDLLAARAGWRAVGGTHLFRLYATPDAPAARDALARARIWTRAFPWSRDWLRLGIPGNAAEWARLEAALAAP